MKIGKRLLLGALGFLSLLIVGFGTAYALKPGNCPPLKEYGPYRDYDVAFVYGGGIEKSMERAIEAYDLHRAGLFTYIVPLGAPIETEVIIGTLIKRRVPQDRIIIPRKYSFSTQENIEEGNWTVKERVLGTEIAHISSQRHLPRIKRTNERLSWMGTNPSDDGYFGREETEYGKSFWQLLPNIGMIKTDSDLTEWYACMTR